MRKKKSKSKYNPQLVLGFTLIEILIVVGMIAILLAVIFSSYFGFRQKRLLEAEALKITTITREAMERSKSHADGEQWGIRFANPAGDGNDFYEIWKGSSYASGTSTDKFLLDQSLRFTQPTDSSTTDIIFVKKTGLPDGGRIIVINPTSGDGDATINIDVSGRVDYTIN